MVAFMLRASVNMATDLSKLCSGRCGVSKNISDLGENHEPGGTDEINP